MKTLDQLRRLLAPLRLRIALLVSRVVVSAVDDSGGRQSIQGRLLSGEVRDDLERLEPYGFTSHPHEGAEGVAVFVGGNRDHGIVIGVDDRRYRLKPLSAGEVALYTDEGDRIKLGRGGRIEVIASSEVSVTAPEMSVSGNLTVGGDVDVGGNVGVEGKVDAALDILTGANLTAIGAVSAGLDVVATTGSSPMGITQLSLAYNSHTHPDVPTGPPVPTA